MKWNVKYRKSVLKDFKKLNHEDAQRIKKFIEINLIGCENPRQQGKPLKGTLDNLWRYRIGNYRIICTIEDSSLTILVLKARHRKEVYT